MAHGFKSFYIFFLIIGELGKRQHSVSMSQFSKSLRHESFSYLNYTKNEAYIGFLASCAPESFYDRGDFVLNSIHTDICYLQHTILPENLLSCSCGIFPGFAALSGWSRRFMINLSINRQTMTATRPLDHLRQKALNALFSLTRKTGF